MGFIKSILARIFVVYALLMFVATMLVIILPVWVISRLPEPARAKALHVVFRGWMGAYMPLIFCPVFRKGKNHFAKGINYVVVLNHNSLADIPVSSPWIPGANKTLAKAEMAKTPLFGLIYKTGSILVDRSNAASRRDTIKKMQQTLAMGINLCLYPEGTRNKTDQPLQPFQDGAFFTAVKAQKPIMPGVIFNTKKILPPDKKFWALPSSVRIDFLDPIPTEGLTTDAVAGLKEHVYKIMETYYIAYQNNGKA